jgi:hypothetical protein
MAVIIILLIFICLVVALLMMPIHVRINPEGEGSYTEKPGFFRLNIDLVDESLISVILNVFFVRFCWHPLLGKDSKTVKKKESAKKSRFDLLTWNRLKFLSSVAWQAIKRSKVKKLYMDLDTSNVIINANLFPVFELMNERPRINLNINYSGNFALTLDVQNNLWNVVRVLIWNLLKRSFIYTKNQ